MTEPEHKNDADELRGLLFETIRAVKSGVMNADGANAVSNAAKQIVGIELAALKSVQILGGTYDSKFVELADPKNNQPPKRQPATLNHLGQPRLGKAY